jgi:putative ABC transport system permease protein
MINHKKKEISIRKVFGSSTFDLIKLIYASYAKMILVSVVVAWCGGYYWLTQWLNNFAFKVALSTFYFAIPVIVMVAVLALSTGFQTYKAAQSNPVDNLRDQ